MKYETKIDHSKKSKASAREYKNSLVKKMRNRKLNMASEKPENDGI